MAGASNNTIPEVSVPSTFWVEPGRSVGDLRRTHGDVFRLRLQNDRSFLCTAGVDAHRTFLVDHLDRVSNHAGWYRLVPTTSAVGKGIIFMDGPEHRWFRRALTPAFSPSAVAGYLPAIQEIVLRRLRTWPQSGVVGVYDEIRAMAFHVAAMTTFGKSPSDDLKVLHKLYRDMMLLAPGIPERRDRLEQEVRPIIRQRLDQPAADVVSLVVRSGGPEGPLTEDEVLAHANTMIVAGHFTTSALAAYLLLFLSSDAQAVAEVLAQLPDTDDLDVDALARIPLLDHALMEAERLVSPLPHLPRRLVEDIEFQGHHVQAGEFLFCSVAGTHRDPLIFADPHKFDPSRFASQRNERRANPLAVAGFNVGPRRCLGTLLAQVMVKVMVHHILRRFSLSPEPEAYAPANSLPMCHPTNAMPFRVEARTGRT